MAKIALYSILFCLVAFGVIFFARYPFTPIRTTPDGIIITYRATVKNKQIEVAHILNPREIEELKQICSPTWLKLIPIGPLEGNPSWYIKLKFRSKADEIIYVDMDEFGGHSKPPKDLLDLLEEKYSGQTRESSL